MFKRVMGAAVAAAIVLAFVPAQAAESVKVGVLKYGTVNWELKAMKANGLDARHGIDVEIVGFAGEDATAVALRAGAVDVIVSDWLEVSRDRASGGDLTMVPYSSSVGMIMVAADSPLQSLADLKGKTLGVAGGPLDKSWLILRAYAEQEYGMDLAGETEQVFGAPPLIYKTAISGGLDGAINFWHFLAKMEADGMRSLVSVDDAAVALGLDPDTPLLGYVLKGETIAAHPGIADALANASQQAKELLATDDAAWERLRPRMNAKSDAEFAALKAGFLAGTPAPGPVDEVAADRMLQLMAGLGGEELLGPVKALPDGVFYRPGS